MTDLSFGAAGENDVVAVACGGLTNLTGSIVRVNIEEEIQQLEYSGTSDAGVFFKSGVATKLVYGGEAGSKTLTWSIAQ